MLAVSDDQPDKGQSRAKRTGQVGMGRRKGGTGSVGPKKRNGRKGVGTQGRRCRSVFRKLRENVNII